MGDTKDLTSIVDLQKTQPPAEAVPDSSLQVPTEEKVEAFESMEEFASPSEMPPTPPADLQEEAIVEGPPSVTEGPNVASQVADELDRETGPIELPDADSRPVDEELPSLPEPPADLTGGQIPELTAPESTIDQTQEPAFTFPAEATPGQTQSSPEPILHGAMPPPAPPQAEKEPLDAQEAIDNIKNSSQVAELGKATTTPMFPFSLRISGHLKTTEKEKLLTLLSENKMGVSEVEIEPQLEHGEVLIPRISEFAGVLIVQAMRDAKVQMSLGPSDQVFSTEDTAAQPADPSFAIHHRQEHVIYSGDLPLAEIPLLAGKLPAEFGSYDVVDAVTATAILKSTVVEVKGSQEYEDAVEKLQLKLKYEAARKQANAVINFSITLTPLTPPTSYRLMATGVAVQKHGGGSSDDFTPEN